MKFSYTEENYIKAIYSIGSDKKSGVSTNAISEKLNTKASSVTDMIKKLADKKLLNYEKYQGVTLTKEGKKIAIETIRKHRLWEVFLVDKLNFGWDEVHEIAEQLEHIQSTKLTDHLEEFLGFPQFDPHGDPIPDRNGKILQKQTSFDLASCYAGDKVIISGVIDTSTTFLVYLNQHELNLGIQLKLISIYDFDRSMVLELKNKMRITLSELVCKNILVKKI